MRLNIENKNVNIPKETIEKYMKIFALSEDQAITMYLEEEGYLENEEIDKLTQKAKENKTDKIFVSDKTTRKKTERTLKENPTKQNIINIIYKVLKEETDAKNIVIVNNSKIIEFTFEGKNFKLDLIQKREKK